MHHQLRAKWRPVGAFPDSDPDATVDLQVGPRRRPCLTDAATWLMAAVVAIGLAGAFVNLGLSSFWIDELFTTWVIGSDHDLSAATARAIGDNNHPPLYYILISIFSNVFGKSEILLRTFSAICADFAAILFLLGLKDFSFRSRLFAMAIATASSFWLYQSQNARSYAFDLLISTIILILSLRVLRISSRIISSLPLLFLTMLIGSFSHYYLLFVSEAVLGYFFLTQPKLRVSSGVWGGFLLVSVFGYIKLIANAHALFIPDTGWIGADLRWYVSQLAFSLTGTVSKLAVPAILTALALLSISLAGRKFRLRPSDILFCSAVPLLVLLAAVTSSAVVGPNFTTRNFLLCTPFLWALLAGLYDRAVPRTGKWAGPAAALVALLCCFCATRVTWRFQPHNTPIRESARWISQQPGCASKPIPVLISRTLPMQPGQAERHARIDYGHYLPGRSLVPVYKEDVMSGATLPDSGCPVVAWGVHYYIESTADAEALKTRLSRPGRPVDFRRFGIPEGESGYWSAFVFYARPPSRT